MDIHIKRENIKVLASVLFDLYNKIFIESYHTRIDNLETFIRDYKDAFVFVAFDNQTPIGFLIFTDRGDFIMLEELGLLTKYQHKGVGSLLIETFLTEITKEIHLITNPRNSQAIIFYLKHGFEISEWLGKYYNNQPWIVLKKHKNV